MIIRKKNPNFNSAPRRGYVLLALQAVWSIFADKKIIFIIHFSLFIIYIR